MGIFGLIFGFNNEDDDDDDEYTGSRKGWNYEYNPGWNYGDKYDTNYYDGDGDRKDYENDEDTGYNPYTGYDDDDDEDW